MAGSLFQITYYVANMINAILYGIVLVLYFLTIRQLRAIPRRTRTMLDKGMVCLATALVLLNTVFWSTQAYFGQMMWIVHADYPGGADAYWVRFGSVWYQTWGITACVVSNLLSDALLTYRCFVIWNSKRIIILPCILWLASLVFSVGLLYGSGKPNGNYFAGIATLFVDAYTAATFAFNLLVTALICARIVYVGRRSRRCYQFYRARVPSSRDAYGEGDGAEEGDGTEVYTGAVAIVVESALPFTVFSFAYLVSYALGSELANAFSFYAMFTCISPLMIALRVLARRAWTRESGTRLFTTTISYRGEADCASYNFGHDAGDFAEKGHTCVCGGAGRGGEVRREGEMETETERPRATEKEGEVWEVEVDIGTLRV